MILETLLGAALEAGLGLLLEAGFGDEAQALKERLTQADEKKRQQALTRAIDQASEQVSDPALRSLLEHRPFQEEVIAGLLDVQGLDIQAVAAIFGDRFPQHARALRRFFATLEDILLGDETWGPILERYQALRHRQDVQQALQEHNLALTSRELVQRLSALLEGAGAIAQDGSVAAGAGGVAIGQLVQVFIQQWGAGPSEQPDKVSLRRGYLKELAREVNLLPWSTVNVAYADPAKGEDLRLIDVYTELHTTELRQVEREEQLRQLLARIHEAERIPAQEAADREQRLLIMGDPGSGKTTFIKHLAYVLAQAGLADDPAPWLKKLHPWRRGALFPVRVELRQMAAFTHQTGRRVGKASLLLGYLRHSLADGQLEDFWPELNSIIREPDQPLLLLLDGLDEVPTAQRQLVVDVVNDCVRRYDWHRYVVTCRPYAYVGQPWRLHHFHEVTLAPFNQEQIDRFIDNWHQRLAGRGRLSQRQAADRTAYLQQAVRRPDLSGLAERPLLLTVMAQLHTFLGRLPDDRIQLYTDAVNLLLQRWEGRLGDETGIIQQLAIPGLKMSSLEAGLYEAAFKAHAGSGAEATADIAESDLRNWLAPYLGGSWDKAGLFVDYIRERAGLLIRHKTEAYTFPHRTFQEFLAACYLVTGEPDYARTTVRLLHEDLDRWREVFLLAEGYSARSHRLGQAIAAAHKLCPRVLGEAQADDRRAWLGAQLAGEALLEIGLVDVQREPDGPALLDRVRGWLVDALRQTEVLAAKERAAAGVALARLGDPRPGVGLRPDDNLPDIAWHAVPAGQFLMGASKETDPMAYGWEAPQHLEPLAAAYAISRYPITNAQFAAFVDDGGYSDKWRRCWSEAGWRWRQRNGVTEPAKAGGVYDLPNHPVVQVSWYEAVAFCRWLTERLRAAGALTQEQQISLPTEAQWEKAARSADGRRYPWGQEITPDHANYDDTGIGSTTAVGAFPGGASPYGVLDLSGNVWEWCCTKWRDDYTTAPDDDLAGEAGRVVRGGSDYVSAWGVRCAFRDGFVPDGRYRLSGFRIVVLPLHHSSL